MSTSRVLLIAMVAVAVSLAGCRPPPPPSTSPTERSPSDGSSAGSVARGGETGQADGAAAPDSFVISDRAAAIVDSIEAAVRDSFAALRAAEIAAIAREDSIRAAARADSLARAAAVRDSLAEAARQDSIAAAETARAAAMAQARQDSIAEAARQDSIAAAFRADSLAEVARQDSIAAAEIVAAAAASSGAEAAAESTRPQTPQERATEDLETLRELGPSYIPYDAGPETIWTTETQATLSKTLLPVLRAESLPATTKTIFWVLISREGQAVETRIQTPSGSDAFDVAARGFLEGLVFLPALRDNRPVASWVVREISLLMQ